MNDPLDSATIGEIMALALHERGIEVLREIVTKFEDADRETLIDAGDELEAAGLLTGAKLLFETAAKRPSCYDVPCPYASPYYTPDNDPHWKAQQERYRKRWSDKRRAWRTARGLHAQD